MILCCRLLSFPSLCRKPVVNSYSTAFMTRNNVQCWNAQGHWQLFTLFETPKVTRISRGCSRLSDRYRTGNQRCFYIQVAWSVCVCVCPWDRKEPGVCAKCNESYDSERYNKIKPKKLSNIWHWAETDTDTECVKGWLKMLFNSIKFYLCSPKTLKQSPGPETECIK